MDRHERLTELFLGACELPAAQWETHLLAACPKDAALRAEVLGMLQQDAKTSAPMDGIAPARWLAGDGELPAEVGGFRILRRIGQGGMGTVYEAEQDNPRRRVALKLLRTGLASPQNLRRFAPKPAPLRPGS